MAATCGASLAKGLLFIYNLIFFVLGIVLIGVAGWILADKRITTPFETVGDVFGSSLLRSAAIVLIFIGVFIILVTILGMVAIWKEHPVLLSLYIALLVFVCIMQIAGGVVAIVFKDQMVGKIKSGMEHSLEELKNDTKGSYYYKNNNDNCRSYGLGKPWDFFQFNFECCGVVGPVDYLKLGYNLPLSSLCGIADPSGYTVPWSCCSHSSQFTDGYSANPAKENVDCTNSVYDTGCHEKLHFNILKYAPALIGIGLGFGFFQLFGIVFAVCLCQNPSKKHY